MILSGHKDDLVFTCCVKNKKRWDNIGNSARVEFSSSPTKILDIYLFKQIYLQSKRTTDDIKSVHGDRLLFISALLPLSHHSGF